MPTLGHLATSAAKLGIASLWRTERVRFGAGRRCLRMASKSCVLCLSDLLELIVTIGAFIRFADALALQQIQYGSFETQALEHPRACIREGIFNRVRDRDALVWARDLQGVQ